MDNGTVGLVYRILVVVVRLVLISSYKNKLLGVGPGEGAVQIK